MVRISYISNFITIYDDYYAERWKSMLRRIFLKHAKGVVSAPGVMYSCSPAAKAALFEEWNLLENGIAQTADSFECLAQTTILGKHKDVRQ